MIRLTKNSLSRISSIRHHYGNVVELDKVEEELNELLKAVSYWRCNKDSKDLKFELEQEIADVYIVLEHLKSITNISDNNVNDAIRFKLERQIKRIFNEKFTKDGVKNEV